MTDYAADVVSLAATLRRAPILRGWSMGGLVAMMAATACEAPACVGPAPSTPSRTLDPAVPLRAGVFGPESRLARDERKAGVIVDVRCPLLIVTGSRDTLWPRHRYDELPLAADHVSIDGDSHGDWC